MKTQTSDVAIASAASTSDIASWNIERPIEQLRAFISAKHAALPDDIEL